jgi:hypothetical protein
MKTKLSKGGHVYNDWSCPENRQTLEWFSHAIKAYRALLGIRDTLVDAGLMADDAA